MERKADDADQPLLEGDGVRPLVGALRENLDEADGMLDMGFGGDFKTRLRHVPEKRQTVFFSATIPRPIQQLIQTFPRSPVNVRVEAEAMTVPAIEQVDYEVDRR